MQPGQWLFQNARFALESIGTTSPQAGAVGTRFVFGNWSDGGAMSHDVTAPSSPVVYTADFTTQYLLTTAVSPLGAGTVTPADAYYDNGALVQLTANANAGYAFANWSGDLSGMSNPQSLVMSAPRSVTAHFTPLATTLLGTLSSRVGPADARVWTVTLSNNGPGAADNALITGFTLTQTFGPACAPVITSPSAFPLPLGSIAPGSSAGGAITINFTGCDALSRYKATIPFSANAGTVTGSIVRFNLFQ